MEATGGGAATGGLGPLQQERAPLHKAARRRWWLVVAALLVLAAVPLILVLRGQRDDRDARDADARQRAVAAEVIRLKRVQAPHRASAAASRPAGGASAAVRLQARAALVDAARASILGDARRRIATGEIEGPVLRVTCGPIARDPAAIPDDRVLSKPIGRYDCLAVRRSIAGADLGYPFVAALDFRRRTYVWCRNTPPQSERGKVLAQVRLERACLAARGKALGTGYAVTPDG